MASAGQDKFDAQDSGRKSITPGFYGNKNKSPITASDKDSAALKKDAAKDKGSAAAAAEAGLADAEKDAAAQEMNDADGVSDIGAKEDNPVDKITSKVASTSLVGKIAVRKLKGKGPVASIIILLFAVGGLMFGAQSMMPFSLLEQLRDKFDGINISNSTRSKVLLRAQMKRKGIKGATTKKVFGGGEVYKLSDNQQKKLAAEGIELKEVEVDGKKKNVLLFDDGSGAKKLVAADDSDIAWLKKLGNGVADVDIEGKKVKVDLDDIETFDVKFRTDNDFMNGYTKSSRTWGGSVGAWFDSHTAKFLNRFALTRKIFAGFIERVQGEEAGNTRSRVSDTINNSGAQDSTRTFDQMEANAKEVEDVDTGKVDENGKAIMETRTDDYGQRGMEEISGVDKSGKPLEKGNSGTSRTYQKDTVNAKTHGNTKQDVADMKTKLETSVSKRVTSAANLIANTSCMILEVVGSAMLIGTAQEAVQLLKVGTSFLESVDKSRAGDGEGSPIHTLGNALTMKTDTVVESDEGATVLRKDVNAMQSNGIMSLYTGLAMNPYDESVKTFTFGETVNNILGNLTVSMASFSACRKAKMAAAITGAVFDVAEIIVGVFTGGVSVLVKKLGKELLFGAAISVGVSMVAEVVISFLVPKIASWFIRDLVTDLAGENYGNAIVAGAEKYMTNNFKFGGGSLADKDNYTTFAIQQQKVLAEQAEYERRTLSPFDVSSQNTFLGSIMKQIITLSTMSSGPTNIVSGLSSMVGSSILALTPSASAADEVANGMIPEEDFEKTCPFLAQIGAYGDAYCNPYIITDMSTIGTDPGDIEDSGVIQQSLDSNGQIKEGTNLAKYVVYCGSRTSEFGIIDNNIMSEIGNSALFNTGNSTADAAIGAIPVIGDLADFFSNKDQLAETGWISGQNCVARGADDPEEASVNVSWDEVKVYQRYVEDQRLYEAIEPGYESTVTAYLNKYYEEHPLDNSYEGILARFSGLTKDQVIATLDVIDYLKYIAEYDPSERYAFGVEFVEQIKNLNLHSEGDNSVSLLENEIIYADTRNRAFAMA